MARKKKKKHGKRKAKHRKNTKRSRAAKRAYKKSGLYKYNLRRKKHGKGKKKYGKKKGRHKNRHRRYAARQAARIDWAGIAKAAQRSKERHAAAAAGFAPPSRHAKYADTPYLARLRKKHKAHKRASSGGGLPAWF